MYPDGDRGADAGDDVADIGSVGSMVGGGAERHDGVSCHRTVEDKECGVRRWGNFESEAGCEVLSCVVGGWGVSNSWGEELVDCKVWDHWVV